MVTKQEAMDEVLWDFIFRRAEEALDESYWEEERQEELSGWIDRNWDDLVKRCASEWSVPEETPCGWVFESLVTRIGGSGWFLVDLWTKETVYDSDIYYNRNHMVLTAEATLRVYIDRLPEPRRLAAMERIHLMPYAPTRFYPPYLDFPTGEDEEAEPREFEVLLDSAFFVKKQLPLPEVILMETFVRSMKAQFIRENPDWWSDWKEVPGAVQRLRRSEEGDLIRDKYRLVIPPFNELLKYPRAYRGVEIRLKFPEISPDQQETVKAEYLDCSVIPLAFHVSAQ